MASIGRFVVISFVGIVAAYKLGKYHAAAAYASSSNNNIYNNNKSKNNNSNNSNSRVAKQHQKQQSKNNNHQRRGDKTKLTSTASNNENDETNETNETNETTKVTQPSMPTSTSTSTSSNSDNSEIESITMKPIGKISSVYRLCVGTPRQGLLAPNSRGRIDLYPDRMSSDSVLDLDQFSHLWVVFIFHLNSTSGKKRANKQFPSKIAPPALGGRRVGVFATRTPHRPNPVGFSLCKIDKIVIPKKKKHKRAKDQPYSVYVSGLDLVDGTPVLDIKPYVPHYDSVGYVPEGEGEEGVEAGVGEEQDENKVPVLQEKDNLVRLPQWVSDGLGKRRPVSFTSSANEQLTNIMTNIETSSQMEFYGVSSGRDESDEDGLQRIKLCIEEVLSVDVRSSFQTKKARKGKFQAERAIRVSDILSDDRTSKTTTTTTPSEDTNANANLANKKTCTQQLDHLLIKYSVEAKEEGAANDSTSAVDTSGSGADDTIVVQQIELIPKKKRTT